ncbi:MAG: hypothetical protein Q7R92_02815 [bacterium]|nr:hypothetical protein [bacterium]
MRRLAKQTNTLDAFFKSKYKVKQLYELYCRNFPKQQYLWQAMVKKKSGQLKILKKLLDKSNGGHNFFKASDYSTEIINYTENFIDRELKLIKVNKTTPKQALATAIRLELSMIEKKSCEMLTPLSGHLESALKEISQDCGRHISVLTRALNNTSS